MLSELSKTQQTQDNGCDRVSKATVWLWCADACVNLNEATFPSNLVSIWRRAYNANPTAQWPGPYKSEAYGSGWQVWKYAGPWKGYA